MINERVDNSECSGGVWDVVDVDFGKGGDNRVRAIEVERQDQVRRAERMRAGKRR